MSYSPSTHPDRAKDVKRKRETFLGKLLFAPKKKKKKREMDIDNSINRSVNR